MGSAGWDTGSGSKGSAEKGDSGGGLEKLLGIFSIVPSLNVRPFPAALLLYAKSEILEPLLANKDRTTLVPQWSWTTGST